MADAGHRERTFTSQDGLRLYYRDYGDAAAPGMPLLCLAGLTRNSRDFDGLARREAARRRVLAPDYRGRGRSAYDPEWRHYEPTRYVGDIGHLLAVAGVRRCVVFGTSLGGLLAMGMGAAHPTALAGVVLNDIGPELDPRGVARIGDYVGQTPTLPDLDTGARHLKGLLGPAFPDYDDARWRSEAAKDFIVRPDGSLAVDYDPALARALRHPGNAMRDLWPLFRSLARVPVLALRGELSDLLSEATFRRMAEEHPRLTAVTVPGRGHVPNLDEPEAVRAIERFLQDIDHDHAHADAA